MERILKAIGKAFKGFFVSLWNDFKESLKHHYLKLLGYISSFVVPVTYLIVAYVEKKPESWAIPIFVWIPVIVFIFVYWFKLRTYLAVKVAAMQVQNDLEKGKHAGAIIVCKTIQVMMTVAPFLLFYFIFGELSKVAIQLQNIFLFLTVCEAVGGLLIILDTIVNVIDYTDV